MADRDPETFAEVKTRLDEIVEAVSDDNLSLDDALSLYEEAVSLGLRASDLLEADIDAESASEEADDSIQNSKADAEDAEELSAESSDSVQSLKTSAESSATTQASAASHQGQENAAHTAAESFA